MSKLLQRRQNSFESLILAYLHSTRFNEAYFVFCCTFVGSMSGALSFSTFSGFSQLFSLQVSTWVLVFASLIVACFAHFLITSIVLMCKSYNGIKQFCGPPAHWLKGHVDRVSKLIYKSFIFNITKIFS